MQVCKFMIFLSPVIIITVLAQDACAGIQRYLRVHNTTSERITVYANFDMIGTVAANGTLNYYIGDSAETTSVLNAESPSGATWHRDVPEAVNDYDWYIR